MIHDIQMAASTNSASVAPAIAPRILPTPSRPNADPAYAFWSTAHYLPSFMAAAYESEMQIEEMYEWQAECLRVDQGRPLCHGNLVYSAPTSGGKTLVAEILLFRYILKFDLYRSRCHQYRTSDMPTAFRALFVVP